MPHHSSMARAPPENRHQRVRFSPYPVDFRYFFVRALKSRGSPSTEPTTSAMASSNAGRRRRDPSPPVNRSRTTSDFDSLRRRDSASISATKASGNRTVNVFMTLSYYISGICAIHHPPVGARHDYNPLSIRAVLSRPINGFGVVLAQCLREVGHGATA